MKKSDYAIFIFLAIFYGGLFVKKNLYNCVLSRHGTTSVDQLSEKEERKVQEVLIAPLEQFICGTTKVSHQVRYHQCAEKEERKVQEVLIAPLEQFICGTTKVVSAAYNLSRVSNKKLFKLKLQLHCKGCSLHGVSVPFSFGGQLLLQELFSPESGSRGRFFSLFC